MGFLLSKHAESLGLLAYPGEHRHHLEPTPVVGGIAMFTGLMAAYLVLDNQVLEALLPALLVLCVTGVCDDRYKLPYWSRFIAQAVAALLMIWLTDTHLSSMGSLLSDNEILLGQWALPVTVFAVIGVINALNMSDGLDGLAGSIVLLVVAGIYLAGSDKHGLLAIIAASVSGFLFWNLRIMRPQARLFMGDAGSTMLGLVLAYLLIDVTQGEQPMVAPVTALWFLLLPLFDAVGVLLIRPLKGKSPFEADRMHYHHFLQQKGFTANQSLVVALMLQAIFITGGVLINRLSVPEHIQFYVFMGLFALYLLLLFRLSAEQQAE